jgi:hypothetical protein
LGNVNALHSFRWVWSSPHFSIGVVLSSMPVEPSWIQGDTWWLGWIFLPILWSGICWAWICSMIPSTWCPWPLSPSDVIVNTLGVNLWWFPLGHSSFDTLFWRLLPQSLSCMLMGPQDVIQQSLLPSYSHWNCKLPFWNCIVQVRPLVPSCCWPDQCLTGVLDLVRGPMVLGIRGHTLLCHPSCHQSVYLRIDTIGLCFIS